MKKNIANFVGETLSLLALIPEMFNATKTKDRLIKTHQQLKRLGTRSILSVTLIIMLSVSLFFIMAPMEAQAAGGEYSLKWSAADPAVNRTPYLPTYDKLTPKELLLPTPEGLGRYSDPLPNAVAYGPSFSANNFDAVSSLMPKDMALGQVVPFEIEIKVSGDTAPENGVISFTGEWDTHTQPGDDFGFDPEYMVYYAFVDYGDVGTIDPEQDAKVDSISSNLVNEGTTNEKIRGTIQVSGLDNGDNIIVEVWVVLKSTIPASAGSNVQTGFVSAETSANDTISVGVKTVPLSQVQDFFTVTADVSVTKTDSPDPVTQGDQLTYNLVVTNNNPTNVANQIVVTDTLDANTAFVSASGAPYSNTANTVTFNILSLSPGESVTLTIVTDVSDTAPTEVTTGEGSVTGGPGASPGTFDLCNAVSVSAITQDPTPANNAYYEPTNVLPAFTPSATLTLLKNISTSPNGPWSDSITVLGGSPVYYKFTINNTGNVPLSPISINDQNVSTANIDPSLPSTLAPGASYSGIVGPVTAATLADTYPNTATASGIYAGETKTSDPDSAEYIVGSAPILQLDKQFVDYIDADGSGDISVNDILNYNLTVSNAGNVVLTNVSVSDSKITTINCPSGNPIPSLAVGASEICTGSYVVQSTDVGKTITNIGTADSDQTEPVTDTVEVPVPQPSMIIDKVLKSNADEDGSGDVSVGDTLTYTITATNNGASVLTNVVITDSLTGQSKTVTLLAPTEQAVLEVTYKVQSTDVGKTITNIGTADSNQTEPVTDTVEVPVTAHPSISIKKSTNGEDANSAPGPYILAGQTVTWTYEVTNTGDVELTNVVVIDDQGVTVTAPKTVLAPGESMTCTATGTAVAGQYKNTGTATGSYGETTVSASDSSYHFGAAPAISIVKLTNGQDVGSEPGPYITEGQIVTWTYTVTNTGNVELTNVVVTDDQGVTVTAPKTVLGPGESMTCTATGTAVAGQYKNTGTATGSYGGNAVSASDSSYYYGLVLNQPSISLYLPGFSTDGKSVSGTFTITNEALPDVTEIGIENINILIEYKQKKGKFIPVKVTGCEFNPEPPFVFIDDGTTHKMTVDFTNCQLGTVIPKGSDVKVTVEVTIANRPDHVFTYSTTQKFS